MAGKSNKKRKSIDPRVFLEEHSNPGPILIIGSDRLRVEEFCKAIFKKWGSSLEDRESVKHLAVKSLPSKPDSLRDKFCSISLFSPHSFFLIKEMETASASLAKVLGGVLDQLPGGVGVVLVAEKLAGNSALKKLATKNGWLYELNELSAQELSKWAAKTLQKRGVPNIQTAALNVLVDISDGSIDTLNGHIEHLALYLNATSEQPYEKAVRKEEILQVFVEHPDPDQFKLIDTVLSGNPAQVECQIRSLATAGKSEFLLLGLISRAVSQYLLVHSLKQEGKNDREIGSSLKLPPGIASRVIRSALKTNPRKLIETKQQIVRTDSLFKNKSLGGEVLLDNLCHFIAD